VPTSPGWPCTSARASQHSRGRRGAGVIDGPRDRHRFTPHRSPSTANTS
jgi:hypothetical protein